MCSGSCPLPLPHSRLSTGLPPPGSLSVTPGRVRGPSPPWPLQTYQKLVLKGKRLTSTGGHHPEQGHYHSHSPPGETETATHRPPPPCLSLHPCLGGVQESEQCFQKSRGLKRVTRPSVWASVSRAPASRQRLLCTKDSWGSNATPSDTSKSRGLGPEQGKKERHDCERWLATGAQAAELSVQVPLPKIPPDF